MSRSRAFAAVSLATAASVAVSSIASAGPMLPALSAGAADNPSIQKVDDRWDKHDKKRVQWERSYHDQRGPGPDNRGRSQGQGHKGPQPAYKGPAYGGGHPPPTVVQRTVVVVKPVPVGPKVVPPPHRRVLYRNVWIVRPYGHWYPGYGYRYHDDEAYHWLAFTAITLSLLSILTIAQQRAHEQAQIDATTAPVGSTIVWNDANAAGSVSVLRDGHSSDGQYCREFQQTVSIGGRSEQAYGIACQQPDGAWRIVDTH